jgi:Flp pilus assembly protein CpaB
MAAAARRRNGRIFILLALVLIVLLAAVVFLFQDQFLPQSPQVIEAPVEPAPQIELVEIVVLAQPVARDTVLREEMLASVLYPQSEMIAGMFYTDKNAIVNKHTRYDLGQGTPLTPSLLSENPLGSEAAVQIPRGMVAVSIPINRNTSVAYGLQPGDHVNIIGSILLTDLDANFQTRLPNLTAQVIAPGPGGEDGPTTVTMSIAPQAGVQGRAELDTTLNSAIYVLPGEPLQRPRLVSHTLMQDVVVLWVGEFPLEGSLTPAATPTPVPAPDGEQQTVVPEPPTAPSIITLIVTPQDAVTLNYLMLSKAYISLALRNMNDLDKYPTQAVTLQFLLDQYGIPNPAKLPYGMEPRLDELPVSPLPPVDPADTGE